MASRSTRTGRVVVALDGPASSGKSSVGGAAAEQLGLRFVDTGLFYRALTALALREGVTADDSSALVGLVDRITLADDGSGRLTHVLLDGEDATDEARGPVVDASVSMFARVPEVRQALLDRQRTLASDGGIVMAGRDIGTVVLPEADLKLFLDASIEERANRRIEERGLDPAGDEAEEVREQLRVRDAIDTGRETAPLRAAADAVHVRTDGNAFADTVEIVAAEIARVMLTPPKATRTRRTRASSKESGPAAPSAPPTPSAPASPKPAAKPRRARPTARARSAKPTSTREDVATPAHESLPTTDPGPFSVAAAVASVDASSGPVRPGGPFHVGHPGPEPAGPLPEAAAVVPEAAADLPAYRGEPD